MEIDIKDVYNTILEITEIVYSNNSDIIEVKSDYKTKLEIILLKYLRRQ
jgi:hypothetical protein